MEKLCRHPSSFPWANKFAKDVAYCCPDTSSRKP